MTRLVLSIIQADSLIKQTILNGKNHFAGFDIWVNRKFILYRYLLNEQ